MSRRADGRCSCRDRQHRSRSTTGLRRVPAATGPRPRRCRASTRSTSRRPLSGRRRDDDAGANNESSPTTPWRSIARRLRRVVESDASVRRGQWRRRHRPALGISTVRRSASSGSGQSVGRRAALPGFRLHGARIRRRRSSGRPCRAQCRSRSCSSARDRSPSTYLLDDPRGLIGARELALTRPDAVSSTPLGAASWTRRRSSRRSAGGDPGGGPGCLRTRAAGRVAAARAPQCRAHCAPGRAQRGIDNSHASNRCTSGRVGARGRRARGCGQPRVLTAVR